jgi:hypothetical protein
LDLPHKYEFGDRVVLNGKLPVWIIEGIDGDGRYRIWRSDGPAITTNWANEDELTAAKSAIP